MTESATDPSAAGVLFVDDEKNILRSLQRLTVDENFPVFVALSGEEGLELLKSGVEIGLIVSDQRMPGMNGAEFLSRAREIVPDAMRILLTGYSDIEATIDAINRGGAYRYVNKPWNDEDLLQSIRDGLKNYILTQENKRLTTIVQQQNEELKEWNGRLKSRVLQQTSDIREKNRELHKKNQSLNKAHQEMIVAFSGLIELYSNALLNHSANVANLSWQVAAAMNLPKEEIEKIHAAARLHDIGELGTPDSLLQKPMEELQGAMLQEYMQHAVRGQAAIDNVEELRPVGILIRHHHEHFDGSGFPDRLKGEAIPLGSRIIAMADYADRTRIFSRRPDVAQVILPGLERLLGCYFDPALFPFFHGPIQQLYGYPTEKGLRDEKVIDPRALQVGMVLARDLYTGTGLLLLNQGTCLDKKGIEAIRRFEQLDPFPSGIAVFAEE